MSLSTPGLRSPPRRAEQLQVRIRELENRVRQADERRRAIVHIIGDLNQANSRLADQRKATLHILADYEQDRGRLARQTEHLDNSRRALLQLLKDSHQATRRLEASRKAMIHIMGDLREKTDEIERRERELRDKQEQLVQAAKLATLGELTTGVAHELNNPLNNIGLFVGNVIDHVRMKHIDEGQVIHDLEKVVEQVKKATEIISHLRTFGRAAPVAFSRVDVLAVIERSLSLMYEQFRLRQIAVEVLPVEGGDPIVMANSIQLEQVFVNLLANARDALAAAATRVVTIETAAVREVVVVTVRDTGPGIADDMKHRVFDPFFTTKEVGEGTGLGLSIAYGIIKEHGGSISLQDDGAPGAAFRIELPLATNSQGRGL